ncbi:MAG TPA: DUF3060 domain-containing protein [Pyrinomonadaceae bacterium]|nr:DUF3060 domain-containing protein [Acidobacteriota bacterium]HQZ97824.1 DUF3060 domain-containing protein [Pyrinomonadaceae bacterium]
MRNFITICVLAAVVGILTSCDVRSGTAKEEMEKFSGSPTPTFAPPSPEITPDPADSIAVDVSMEGSTITVLGYKEKKSAICSKFDRVMINGDDNVLNIKGGCSQIVANGDRNQITAEASLAFVLNGSDNSVKYSKYVNGRRPTITEPVGGNTIEKIPAPTAKK